MSWHYVITNQLNALTKEQKKDNATEIFDYLNVHGWTINAISGLLGNLDVESELNPAQTQENFPVSGQRGGYGLPQWAGDSIKDAPVYMNKYKRWCGENDYDITNGNIQLYAINTQPWGTEYTATNDYPLTYSEFKTSTETPEYLARAFFYNYERGTPKLEERQAKARYWYNYLSSPEPPPPTPPTPTPTGKKIVMPIYLYPCFTHNWLYYQ